MSDNGATKNYKFGQKNHWRRTIHNIIADSLGPRRKDKVVLYLAGEQDLDRPEFLRRGFSPHNLIAVEKDKGVATALRQSGTITLNEDLINVLANWRGLHVDVIFADFCGGLTADRANLIQALIGNECFAEAIVAINLLRGRDASGNGLRETVNKALEVWGENAVIHRGAIFHELYLQWLFITAKEVVKNKEDIKENIYRAWSQCSQINNWRFTDDHKKLQDQAFDYIENIATHLSHKRKNLAYKSGPQVFDSCVFRNFTVGSLIVLAVLLPCKFIWPGVNMRSLPSFAKSHGLRVMHDIPVLDRKVARQISAIKAVRTMRLAP